MYWTYENWVHNYAKVHRADCTFCRNGEGTHGATESRAGKWIGPSVEFANASEASVFKTEACSFCSPIAN